MPAQLGFPVNILRKYDAQTEGDLSDDINIFNVMKTSNELLQDECQFSGSFCSFIKLSLPFLYAQGLEAVINSFSD